MPTRRDPLETARTAFLRRTAALMDSLSTEDLPGTLRKAAPGLVAARHQARSAALDAVKESVSGALHAAVGTDLGWESVNRDRWVGDQTRAAYAARISSVADSLGERIDAGQDPGDLAAWTRYWQLQIAGSDVHDVARRETIDAAGASPLGGRVMRIAEPNACSWCLTQASRGPVFHGRDTALAMSHGHCRCTITLVTDTAAITDLVDAGRVAWAESGMALQEFPLRSRSAAMKVSREVFRTGAQTPERAMSVRLQIASLEDSIPQLRAAVKGGDKARAAALAWQETRLADLRAELVRLVSVAPRQPAGAGSATMAEGKDRVVSSIDSNAPSMTRAERTVWSDLDRRVSDVALTVRPAALRAIETYQDGGHRLLNRVLWEAPESRWTLNDREQGLVRAMEDNLQWMASNYRSPGVDVWRGIPHGYGIDHSALEPGDLLPPSLGYMSTTVARSVAEGFLSDSGSAVLFRLRVPEGSPGVWLPLYGSSQWSWQGEFLLPPNCRILVSEVRRSSGFVLVTGEVG